MSQRRPVLYMASKQCKECLMGRGRIVSGARATEIIRKCRATSTHFQCHKGSIAGINLHCRGFHNRFGSAAAQIAQRLGIETVEVDPDEI